MEAKKKRQQFSQEMHSNLVKLVINGGRKASEVAKEHGVPAASVYAWVRQARVDTGELDSSRGTTADRSEIVRLRKALKERDQELTFLKNIHDLSRSRTSETLVLIGP